MAVKLIKATHQGNLPIGDKKLDCAVLEDGTRVITQTTFLRSLGRSIRPVAGKGAASFEKLPAFLAPKNLKPFISKELELSMKPIIFKPLAGGYKGQAFGYRAETLPMVCWVYIDAEKEGKLLLTQKHMAEAAKIIIRGLATIGIIALIDEATGYQEIRDRIALQKILDKYITDEWAKWTKTFPDEYYRELFKLRKIPYPPTPRNRPQYVGHWTNDLVYSRLAPGVLKELKEKNPTTLKGHRKRRFHQYLTRDWGHPELRDHLSKIIFLMKSCTTWDDFKRRLNRASPKYGDTMPLDFPESKN